MSGDLIIHHNGVTHVLKNAHVVFDQALPMEDVESFLIRRGWSKENDFCWHKRFPTADFRVGRSDAMKIETCGYKVANSN
jgi:hypothetical protein